MSDVTVKLPHAPNPRVAGARPGRSAKVVRDKQVLIRLTAEEYERLATAASASDEALANWARRVLLKAASANSD
jgi:hypothetical protein